MSIELTHKPKVRLKFIDMARSIAILLMLEGHFVDDSLMNPEQYAGNMVFETWKFIRAFTAPVFLMVTGLIFVYLLLQKRELPYFDNIRIKKGFKRVIELFIWGFLLQFYAFHVLECIAVGIFSILLIFGIYKLIRVVPLWIYFFIAGVALFGLYPYFRDLPKGPRWPQEGWYFLQNMFYGHSNSAIFPIVPWMGYTMFGAMIGSLLHDFHKHVMKFFFPLIFMIVGLTLLFYSKEILNALDVIIELIYPKRNSQLVSLDWLYGRVGMVLIELSVLMFIDKYFGAKIRETNLFLKVGQNTLTIYIIHMIILYGSITGMGLNKVFHKNLSPWEVTLGACTFILIFVIFIKYLDWIKMKLNFILKPLKKFFDRIFGVA